jgi:hypothetical protein
MAISWFGPENQVGYVLSVVPQNRREDEDGAGHASRSRGLLRLEMSLAWVSQSSLKTGVGAAQMVHVTSSSRSCGDEAKDGWVDAMGCIGLFYPNFAIFVLLGHKGSLVISFPIKRPLRVDGEDQAFSHPSPTPKPKLLFERCGCASWCKKGEERK